MDCETGKRHRGEFRIGKRWFEGLHSEESRMNVPGRVSHNQPHKNPTQEPVARSTRWQTRAVTRLCCGGRSAKRLDIVCQTSLGILGEDLKTYSYRATELLWRIRQTTRKKDSPFFFKTIGNRGKRRGGEDIKKKIRVPNFPYRAISKDPRKDGQRGRLDL